MLLLLLACAKDDPAGPLGFGAYTVQTTATGWTLSIDDRHLLGGSGPRFSTFEQTFDGGIGGIWDWTELGRSDVHLNQLYSASSDKSSVTLTFTDAQATSFATLTLTDAGDRVCIEVIGPDHTSVALPIACEPGGTFHGFGERYHHTDQRGEAFELFLVEQGIGRNPDLPRQPINGDEQTTYFPMPYYVDPRGVGFLMDGDARALVDVCATDDYAWFESIQPGPLTGHVFTGPTAYDVIEQLSDVVGRPARPPKWAWGTWMGSQGGRDAVLADVAKLQDEDVPFTAIWSQDWTGIRQNLDGGFGVEYRWRVDDELYPDLRGMIMDLARDDIRFLSYANAFIDPDLDHWEDMDGDGLLIVDPETGASYQHTAPNLISSHPDFTREATRAYVKAELRNMVRGGHDGWMADFGEWLPPDAVYADGSDPVAMHNRFPLEWHRTWREVMDEERPDGDYAVINRSGWTGVQEHIQIMWVGDQEANWEEHDGLPTVVPAMLTLGLSGVPYVTHDIGGFSGGPRTKELWMRWTELGAFTPVMRTHEGNDKLNNWDWDGDAETIEHFRRFARIHEALEDDLEALADEAEASSKPMVRALFLEFPDDEASLGVSDEYLLGDLLVAPVVEEGADTRRVYLPPGSWFHVFTGEEHEGPDTIEVDAPIGTPPVFNRGSDRTDLRAL